MGRLNWQANAYWSEHGNVLPGEQPNRFQNKQSERLYRVSYRKVSIKTFNWTHLGKVYSRFSETYVFFKRTNSVEKQLLNFRMLLSHTVSEIRHSLSFGIIYFCLITNGKGILNLEKKHILRNIFL